MTSVYIMPKVRDSAIGGISRVIEAQIKHLPSYGIEVVDDHTQADVLAMHATSWIEPTVKQKAILHCHGLYWSEYNWDRWASNVNADVIENIRRSDAVTVPSEWVANAVRRDTWLEPKVIGHGVDIEDWHPLTSNNYVLWNKTRVDAACDPRPVNVLAGAMPQVRFVSTFGDETPNVKVVGTLPYNDHKEYIMHAGLYLCTARETFGIGTLEAMACGVPVVGWNYGGQSDIIEQGKTGWLSTPGDYPDLMAGIEFCLAHRLEMAQRCRSVVEQKYQWKGIIGQYAKLYENLAKPESDIKVSVIVSSYNLGQFLPDCIKSVVQQDYTSWELIIVDDCSTDGSYEIAKACEAQNVRVLRTPHNSNMPGVLNLGISHARGKYILPLDADNMLAPGALKTLASELDKNRNYDVVYGRIRFTTEDGVTPDTRVSGDGISSWPPDVFNYENQMEHRNQIPSTAMYRRKWWELSGGYRWRCKKIGEDPDFWCRITTLGAKPHKVTDAVTLIYRIRDDSRSNTIPEWPWERWYQNRGFMVGGPVHISEPVVSVIIPVGPGHGVQGIEDALDSLYNQTFTNWECIVVNDTGEELRWLPTWARLFTTGGNHGVSVARNIGMSKARGQCFVFLDADDYLDRHALEKLYAAWKLDESKYVYSDWYSIDDMLPREIGPYTPESLLENIIHPVCCIYPIRVRDKIKFDETMRVGEDWDFILNVVANGYCGMHLQEPLMYYRQTSGSNRRGLKENKETIRSKMQERWGSRVMACGCSGNNKIATQKEQLQNQQNSFVNTSDLVLLEYTGGQLGSISYTGHATGTSYRFGMNNGNNIKYVHRADAEHLLQRSEFRIANTELITA